jgi:hypothetical protein
MARVMFESAGVHHPAEAHPNPGESTAGGVPRIAIHTGWWQARKLRPQVVYLWQLAYAGHPIAVSPVDFARLPSQINEVKAALLNGTVRLHGPGESA